MYIPTIIITAVIIFWAIRYVKRNKDVNIIQAVPILIMAILSVAFCAGLLKNSLYVLVFVPAVSAIIIGKLGEKHQWNAKLAKAELIIGSFFCIILMIPLTLLITSYLGL